MFKALDGLAENGRGGAKWASNNRYRVIPGKNGEAVAILNAEEPLHWIRRPDTFFWTNEYAFTVINKAQYETYKAIGIPECKVKYKRLKKWLAAQRNKKRTLIIFLGMAFLFVSTFIYMQTSDPTIDWPWVFTWALMVLSAAYIMTVSWASDTLDY